MSDMRRRPFYVLAFISLLALVQLAALGRQWSEGFRPFRSAPGRVPFSWDMFAPRIERCAVFWSPPLPGPLHTLAQLSPRLEWDLVLGRVDDYRQLAEWSCGKYKAGAALYCFLPEGKAVSSALACR